MGYYCLSLAKGSVQQCRGLDAIGLNDATISEGLDFALFIIHVVRMVLDQKRRLWVSVATPAPEQTAMHKYPSIFSTRLYPLLLNDLPFSFV